MLPLQQLLLLVLFSEAVLPHANADANGATAATIAGCGSVPAPPPSHDCEHPPAGFAFADCYAGGYNATDSTAAVAGALADIGRATVVIPALPGGAAWPVLPLHLNGATAMDRVVVLAEGAVLQAKRGAYHGLADALVSVDGGKNISFCGLGSSGATLRMWRSDYNNSHLYNHSEHRHGISIWNTAGVALDHITVELTGGDGIYVHGVTDLDITNVVASDNYRQGMSITDAARVRVRNATFAGTDGTAPRAGVDLEPNVATDALSDISFSNCTFADNAGAGMQLWLGKLNASSAPISVSVVDCAVTGGRSAGFMVGGARQGLRGNVSFARCSVSGSAGPGLALSAKSAGGPLVLFSGGSIAHTAAATTLGNTAAPVELVGGDRTWGTALGGLVLEHTFVEDDADPARPWLLSTQGTPPGTSNVSVVNVTVSPLSGRHGAGCTANLSQPLSGCDLEPVVCRPVWAG